MAKSTIQNIELSTATFQTWLDSTNELIDLMKTDVVTASAIGGGDVTIGNVTLQGTLTADYLATSNRLNTPLINAPIAGGDIDFGDHARFKNEATSIVATFLNNNGAKTNYSTSTVNWSVGLESSSANTFIITTGGGSTLFKISSSGVVTIPGVITTTSTINGTSNDTLKLKTAITIESTGDVVWNSGNFDGSASVSTTATIQPNAVTNTKIRDSVGLSVIGRSASTTGDPADIAAASDHQVLRRSGTSLAFGAIALNQSSAVSGILPIANGGTGASSLTSNKIVFMGASGLATDTTLSWDNTNKRVGINNSTPAYDLDISGTARSTNLIISTNGLFSAGTAAAPGLSVRDSNTGLYSSATGILNATTAGTLAATFASNGDFTAVGNLTAYSDERLKSNIITINNALDKVTQLRGVYYTKNGETGIGVIAQEIEKILPEVVVDGGEYKSVAYGNIVGVLIEAIKELNLEIEKLKGV